MFGMYHLPNPVPSMVVAAMRVVLHLGEVAASHGYTFLFPQIHVRTHTAKHHFSLNAQCTKTCFDGEYIPLWSFIPNGLRRGSVLAPTLFNWYTNDLLVTKCRRFAEDSRMLMTPVARCKQSRSK